MSLRCAAFAAISVSFALAQSAPPAPAEPTATASATNAAAPEVVSRLRVDESDPLVMRARERLMQVQKMVSAGALPLIHLKKAQAEVQDALDLSLLKQSLYMTDLLPEEADQMVAVAQRMVVRRQRALLEMQELVGAGVIARSEADMSNADLDRAKQELDWAESRAKLVAQLAENARIQKGIASLEVQAESHPDWAGQVYSHYEGNGVFTPTELQQLQSDYAAKFFKPLPISAEGETAVHRSLGFDHRGRVDVAVTPDQPEGVWLMHYLEAKRIPYFAFRAAVPHKATGAHIHVGPESTKLALSD
ncbi:MAG TPA: hypothetical protein VK789_06200 [Bryobacteraceae bacterium]|nr:hypothetical protein [Bryobacteraceae bacterium]